MEELSPFYQFLDLLGLNTIVRRFFFAFIVVGFLEFMIKPWWSFDSSGERLPWGVLSEHAAGTTQVPFLAIPVVAGLLFGLWI
jgi:hypothetical protein